MITNTDRWKDELLGEPYFSLLTLALMESEQVKWLRAHPTVFVSSPNSTALFNLLHPDNAGMAQRIKRAKGK